MDNETVTDWAQQQTKEALAYIIACALRKRMGGVSAIFHLGGRAFRVVEFGGREYRERLREEDGRLIGTYTPDVSPEYLAEDVELML